MGGRQFRRQGSSNSLSQGSANLEAMASFIAPQIQKFALGPSLLLAYAEDLLQIPDQEKAGRYTSPQSLRPHARFQCGAG